MFAAILIDLRDFSFRAFYSDLRRSSAGNSHADQSARENRRNGRPAWDPFQTLLEEFDALLSAARQGLFSGRSVRIQP
jgi:hypothetical protein